MTDENPKQIAVENISDYLMISHKDAEKFYEWALGENYEPFDCIERWINTKTKKLVTALHVYDLYKLHIEMLNLKTLLQ